MIEPLVIWQDIGDGAAVCVANPKSFENGGVEWRLRYGDPVKVRFLAATLVAQFNHLCGNEITTKEAIALLRKIRRATAALKGATNA